VNGSNSSLRFDGDDANIDTNGSGGSSVTTLRGSTGNTGDIDGTGVDFHLHGNGNVFQYNGGSRLTPGMQGRSGARTSERVRPLLGAAPK